MGFLCLISKLSRFDSCGSHNLNNQTMKKTLFLVLFAALITITSCTSPTNTAAEKVKETGQKETIIAAHYGRKIGSKVPKLQQDDFLNEVQVVAKNLKVSPNWLLYCFGFEGDFEVAKKNYAGSGATGLIQFMPKTAEDFGTTTEKLAKMTHLEQLEYVEKFLQREMKSNGEFYSLTDLYFGILYPPARKWLKSNQLEKVIWVLGTKSYEQNKGLDHDKNGKITVLDVCKHTHHRFNKEMK